MKRLILILLAAFTLCACGKSENSIVFPKVDYATAPMVTLTPVVTEAPELTLPSKVESLYVMDVGYCAEDVACIDNTMLVADIDSREYQLVWLRLAENKIEPVPLERKVIRQNREDQEIDESRIYDITISSDGFYYVLLGEMPRFYLMGIQEGVNLSDAHYIDNDRYAGRYRIEKYDTEGDLQDTLYLKNLPLHSVNKFLVMDDGTIVLLGGNNDPDAERAMKVIIETEVALLLSKDGEIIEHSERDMRNINSVSTDGNNIIVSIEGQSIDSGYFARIFPESGEEQMIITPWSYGVFDRAYCVESKGTLVVNNQYSFGIVEPDSGHFTPLLNSIPEEIGALADLEDTYYPFSAACRFGFESFVVALKGYDKLLVFSPAL